MSIRRGGGTQARPWGRKALCEGDKDIVLVMEYFKPMWRWAEALQNDFAARADWSVKSYAEANHPPVVQLGHALDLTARPGETVRLSAGRSTDPDGDELVYRWWQYQEADSYAGTVEFPDADGLDASFVVPSDAEGGETIHVIAEVTDTGAPSLTRYQRVVVTIER